jgi:hypothetical protein
MAEKTRAQINADYVDRLKRVGFKKVTVWLPPSAQAAIATLKTRGFPSQDSAIAHSVEQAASRGDRPAADAAAEDGTTGPQRRFASS